MQLSAGQCARDQVTHHSADITLFFNLTLYDFLRIIRLLASILKEKAALPLAGQPALQVPPLKSASHKVFITPVLCKVSFVFHLPVCMYLLHCFVSVAVAVAAPTVRNRKGVPHLEVLEQHRRGRLRHLAGQKVQDIQGTL